MANPDRPSGLQAFSRSGVEPVLNNYQMDASSSSAARGDVVDLEADGNVDRAAAGATTIVGVFHSCRYEDSAGKLVYSSWHPASTAAEVLVYDQPDIEYIVQPDNGGTLNAIAQTLLGENADHVNTAPTQLGTSGHSNHELDADTTALDTGAATMKVKRLYERADMVFSATEADSRFGLLVVSLGEHFWNGVYTTDGTSATTVPVSGI